MSFYSALMLCANVGVDAVFCSESVVHSLLDELDLLDPEAEDEFGNLHSEVCDLFADAAATEENERFFRPDTINLETEICITSLSDQSWESDGFSVSLSGHGYFFPRELSDYRTIIETTKLAALAERADALFGGKFKFPVRSRSYLRQRCIIERNGWCWFGSET